ncbi:arginase family protein [Comamonas composti]|uniref:arginase family protein n=1 Tax=Comamonas composti TaxID=408558 RepID=UPI0003F826A8|nr:arginase family protein [Comamonas composti]
MEPKQLNPVVLDVDGSVGALAGELRLPLQHWQEAVRFGCGLARFNRFRTELDALLPPAHGTVLMGSGDFHHLSWPLVERCIARQALSAAHPLRVIVLDNHPDNMRFPWGVHCGSWVRRVALHPAVSHVHVAGITSQDIGPAHAWENYLTPLRAGKLSYWSCGVNTAWAARVGAQQGFRNFASLAELSRALKSMLREQPQPTYLSIDKDVFDSEVVRTNWDQGRMQEEQALAIIDALAGQLVGSDITGDVSSWRYATWWKRLMSAGDGQDTQIDAVTLAAWQAGQHALNRRLVECLADAAGSTA